MNRSIQFLTIAFMLMFVSAISAQTPKCGVAEIEGPTEVDPGPPIKFKAKLANPHASKPEFKWWVSAGGSFKGQGTDEITIETAEIAGWVLTATVALVDAPPECTRTASITVNITPPPPVAGVFETYGDISFEDENVRLDNLAAQIVNLTGSTGHILMSAGRISYKDEAGHRLERIRQYLYSKQIPPHRFNAVNCGFTEEFTVTIYVVPANTTFPVCSTERHVSYSDVEFTKPRPKSKQ